MRILSGKYKGRIIKMPKGIRLTQDKVRKALFDILKDDIEGCRFLDLFAGSGVVGIEALSRGAKEAVFLENNGECLKIIKDNLSLFGRLRYNIIAQDVFEAIMRLYRKKEKFEIIFLDPPYYKDMSKKTLQTLSDYDILTRNGFIIIQHFKKDELPQRVGKLVLWRMSRYGDTLLSFYRKAVYGSLNSLNSSI